HFAGIGDGFAVIPGFFNLTFVTNTGAAWGIFGGQNHWLSAFSVVMLLVMVFFRRHFLNDTWDHKLALGLMIGGIIGNLLDRVRLGFVTDFLDFYIGQSHFPAFNIADSAICVGVGIYIISAFWASKHPLRTPPAVPQANPKPET
ncbi:MAG TPA: signal peptidase II, partial [Kiritimatiellia bacterium]